MEWTHHYADWPDRHTSAGIYRCPGNGAGITRSIERYFPWAGTPSGSCEHLPVGHQFVAPGRDTECEAAGEPDVEPASGCIPTAAARDQPQAERCLSSNAVV